MRRVWFAAPVVALALAAPAQAAEIGRIRVHLVYEGTGRLSPDIGTEPNLGFWNTVIGGGEAEEPASDVLILVEVVGESGVDMGVWPGQANSPPYGIDGPLEISARGEDGRVLGRRRFRESILTGDDGSGWKALWLPDATCAGRIQIEARIGDSMRRAEIALNCGE